MITVKWVQIRLSILKNSLWAPMSFMSPKNYYTFDVLFRLINSSSQTCLKRVGRWYELKKLSSLSRVCWIRLWCLVWLFLDVLLWFDEVSVVTGMQQRFSKSIVAAPRFSIISIIPMVWLTVCWQLQGDSALQTFQDMLLWSMVHHQIILLLHLQSFFIWVAMYLNKLYILDLYW